MTLLFFVLLMWVYSRVFCGFLKTQFWGVFQIGLVSVFICLFLSVYVNLFVCDTVFKKRMLRRGIRRRDLWIDVWVCGLIRDYLKTLRRLSRNWWDSSRSFKNILIPLLRWRKLSTKLGRYRKTLGLSMPLLRFFFLNRSNNLSGFQPQLSSHSPTTRNA